MVSLSSGEVEIVPTNGERDDELFVVARRGGEVAGGEVAVRGAVGSVVASEDDVLAVSCGVDCVGRFDLAAAAAFFAALSLRFFSALSHAFAALLLLKLRGRSY